MGFVAHVRGSGWTSLGGHDRGFSGGQLQVGVGVVGRHDAIINL